MAALMSSSLKSVKELGFSGVATTGSGEAGAARGSAAAAAARKAGSMSLRRSLAAIIKQGRGISKQQRENARKQLSVDPRVLDSSAGV